MDDFDLEGKFGVDAYKPERDGLLYKYFNIERGLEAVTNEELYFSPPAKLNDSFELDIAKIEFEPSDENIQKLLNRRLPNNADARAQLFELFKKNRHLAPDAIKKVITELRNQCGICCFTTNPRNKLMWGSYGVSDTGICIGFDLPPYSPLIKDMFVMKVRYEQERSFINYSDDPHIIFPQWAFVKNKDWDYEEEIRAVRMNYNGLLRYGLNDIKEIHYGMKTKEENIGKVESLMALKNQNNYNRFKIQSSPKTYDLLSAPF